MVFSLNRRTCKLLAFVGSVALLSLCAMAVRDGGAALAEDTSLQRRVQQLEDEKQIRDVMIEYGRLLDRGDFAGYSALFASNGEWSGLLRSFTTVKGPANIRAAMEKNFADRKYDPQHVTNLHLMSNLQVDFETADRAKGYSRWTVLSRNDKNEPYPRVSGRYDDVFVRENGRWKLLSRTAAREIP